MADVELVIKAPEELYKAYKGRPPMLGDAGMDMIAQAIANGTPLPKGHGRIDDIDKILEEMRATRTYDIPFALDRVKPIIEADNNIYESKDLEEDEIER